MDNLKQVKHLYARAGFGLRFEDIKAVEDLSVKQAVSALFSASKNDEPVNSVQENTDYAMLIKGDKDAKKQFLQEQRQEEKELNEAWMNRMSTTGAVLREKMTLFWHNHFAIKQYSAEPCFRQFSRPFAGGIQIAGHAAVFK
jgi:uncharacterized protein (DUF1800 family)